MVLLVQRSSKLSLPYSLPQTTSVLFEPYSLSLALTHSDSSLSLFPSLSPSTFPSFSFPFPPKPQALIPPPSSSSSFLLLQQQEEPNNHKVLFLVTGPHKGGSQVLLRVYILQSNNLFAKVQVFSNQKGIGFDPKLGVLLDIDHGVSLKVVGSVNFFVIYSVSSKKVWVFGVKLFSGENGEGDSVKLMRCAEIDCFRPVWSLNVSFGFLILGEDGGVRVFNLRLLVKGKVKRVRGSNLSGNLNRNGKVEGKGLKLPNGVVGDDNGCNGSRERSCCNGFLEGKIENHASSAKQKSVKCRQDSVEVGAHFLAFKVKEMTGVKSMTVKAISIQALTLKKFLILDSSGDLYVLDLSNHVGGSSIAGHMRHLPYNLRVQKLAVLPDISSKINTVWVSDGFHSVHKLTLSDLNAGINNIDGGDSQEELMQISVVQAIFTAEAVQDLIPIAADLVLMLGQGHIYAYAIP